MSVKGSHAAFTPHHLLAAVLAAGPAAATDLDTDLHMAMCAHEAMCAEPPAASGPPDVLLISLDTVRADSVSAYGEVSGTTPAIDALVLAGSRGEGDPLAAVQGVRHRALLEVAGCRCCCACCAACRSIGCCIEPDRRADLAGFRDAAPTRRVGPR